MTVKSLATLRAKDETKAKEIFDTVIPTKIEIGS